MEMKVEQLRSRKSKGEHDSAWGAKKRGVKQGKTKEGHVEQVTARKKKIEQWMQTESKEGIWRSIEIKS